MEVERPKKSETMSLLRKLKPKVIGRLERPSTKNYQNMSESFVLKQSEKVYTQQYWKTYYQRLNQIKEYFLADFAEKNIKVCDKILNIKVAEHQIIIATLYKEMKLKPSVLIPTESKVTDNYMSEDDTLFIEDSTGRMQLAFNNTVLSNPIVGKRIVDVKNFTTGIVVAVRGIQRVAEINVFEVDQIYGCDLPHQEHILDLPAPPCFETDQSQTENNNNNYKDLQYYINNAAEQKFVLLTSGLNIDANNNYGITQLKNHLFGLTNLKSLMSRVCRVVLAGNLIEKSKDVDYNLVGSYRMQEQFKNVYAEITKKMRDADKQVNIISSNVCFDVMTGDNDPSQVFLPQQSLSKCYFTTSMKNPTLQLVSNPYKFQQDGLQLLGVSGQTIQDAKKCSIYSDHDIDILESHILWRHISPTAPDTLQCFPFSVRDPFVVDELPHIYFAGNCSKFETKVIYEAKSKKRCRLICVPALSMRNSFVLVNVNNLDTFEVQL